MLEVSNKPAVHAQMDMLLLSETGVFIASRNTAPVRHGTPGPQSQTTSSHARGVHAAHWKLKMTDE